MYIGSSVIFISIITITFCFLQGSTYWNIGRFLAHVVHGKKYGCNSVMQPIWRWALPYKLQVFYCLIVRRLFPIILQRIVNFVLIIKVSCAKNFKWRINVNWELSRRVMASLKFLSPVAKIFSIFLQKPLFTCCMSSKRNCKIVKWNWFNILNIIKEGRKANNARDDFSKVCNLVIPCSQFF